MMRIDIATLFPDMCNTVLDTSIIGRARTNGSIEIYSHNIRDYTENKHRKVDDKPYGGGTGMVMQAQPIYDCIKAISAQHKKRPLIIYMTPKGKTLTQELVKDLAEEDGLILLCGHYEGVDQRVLDELDCEEISIGDYVLTGGELPALVLADAIARLQEGVLPNEDAYSIESHYNGLLEYPQYTMPEEWKGRKVPPILLSGDRKKITEWQFSMARSITQDKRPDMYEDFIVDSQNDFWEEFLTEKGLDEDTECRDFICFSQHEGEAVEIARQVMKGKKRATSQTLKAYEIGGVPLPKVGEYWIVTDCDGYPYCVIKTIRVRLTPFNEFTEEQAKREDYPTLEDWRKIAKNKFLTNSLRFGYKFSEDMTIVTNEFRVEYKRRG